MDLLSLSCIYQLKELENQIKSKMVSNLVTENALVFFYNMDKFKSEGYDHMREKTLEYIIDHLDKLWKVIIGVISLKTALT